MRVAIAGLAGWLVGGLAGIAGTLLTMWQPLEVTRVIGVASAAGMYYVGVVYNDGRVESWDVTREPTPEEVAAIMAIDKEKRITVVVPACTLLPQKLSSISY